MMKGLPPQRVYALVAVALIVILSLGLIGGGVLLLSHRLSASAASPAAHFVTNDIAPSLAVRALAGDADNVVIDQALEENKLETAFSALYYSTTLSDKDRANYYVTLGQKYVEAKNKARGRLCFDQATSILLLSYDAFDATKASLHLTIGKDQSVLGDRTTAERSFDYAYTIARYSPYVDDAQRRFILGNLASEYKALGADRKSDESTRALSSLTGSVAASPSPAQTQLAVPALGDDVKAATAWRVRAAQRLLNSLGSKSSRDIETARLGLQDALRAEDDLRSLSFDNRLSQATTADARAALAKAQADWLTLRWRIAQKGFGLSLMPAWEKSSASIGASLRQAMANYFLLRREMAITLPDPVDAAQARLDLLREEMMLGKIGSYPDYPENRLISEVAQATKERIDLREDGLYVAVLSQQGGGQLVITTADLWGRPAAMASAGVGMSFPTTRPAALAYVPTPSPLPTQTAAPTALSIPATETARPSQAPATATATPVSTQPAIGGAPTQPGSPAGSSSRTAVTIPSATPINAPVPTIGTATQPTPAPTIPLPPSPTPLPTATPMPRYNYQVIYKAGPTVRQETGNDNFHIVGMVVDMNGILMSGVQERISWCCPAGQAIRPRPTIDVDNGRFDFFIPRGQYTLDVVDGGATTQPVVVNTDVAGLTGYVEWEYTFQHTSLSVGPYVSPTPTPTFTPTMTGTPLPPSPTPPLPGAVTTRIALDPGWNFIGMTLSPITSYSASALQSEINGQINLQGGGVSQVAAWDGARISAYGGSISLGVGYFLNITGTNRVYWQQTGYPLNSPVALTLTPGQKTSITIPYMVGGARTAADVRNNLEAMGGTGTFLRLWRLRDSQGNWDYYDGTPTGIASFQITPERGYLIEVARSISWSPWALATPTLTSTPTLTPSVTPTASPTPQDTFEPNNTFDQAYQMQPDTPAISFVSYPGDLDYYKFTVAAPTTIYLSLTNLPSDYDLYLYGPTKQEIDGSFTGGLTPEYITKTVTLAGMYYAEVQGAGPVYDTVKPYKLLLTFTPQN
jgi:hypothetical protein